MNSFTFQLDNSGDTLWKTLSKHEYSSRMLQASCELIDNAISALRQILDKTKPIGRICFHINENEKTASIEDNGPGFPTDPEELRRCLSYGSAKPNGLNEHGCGAKTALSIFDKDGNGWKIYWKNDGSPNIYLIQGPLRNTMTVQQVDVWPGKLQGSSGVYMSFPCSQECFRSLYGRNVKKIDTADAIRRFRRELAQVYFFEPNIGSGKIHLEVNDERVEPFTIDYELIKSHNKHVFMLGENKVFVQTIRSDEGIDNSWFKVNTSSLGIYIWKNGRFISHTYNGDLFERMTGLKHHPSMSGKFVLVNLVGDQKTLPPTDPNKVTWSVHSDEFNEFVSELYKITSPFFRTKETVEYERDHVKEFVSVRRTMGIQGYTCSEEYTFEGATPKIDIVEEFATGDVRIYEAKRSGNASIDSIGQLHRNYILAKDALESSSRTISKAILLLNCDPGDSFMCEPLERQVRVLMKCSGCPIEIHSFRHGLLWPKPKEPEPSVKPKKVKPSKASGTT